MSEIREILEKWDIVFFDKITGAPRYMLEDYYFLDYLNRKSLSKIAASDKEINKFKDKFGSDLCPDIEEFYRITNGWDMPFFDAEPNKIIEISKLEYTRDFDPDFLSWATTLEDFEDASYSTESPLTYIRQRDTKDSIAISENVDCGYVIANPGFKTCNRWEIFLYTPRAECRRFSSLLEYLKFAYNENLSSLNEMTW